MSRLLTRRKLIMTGLAGAAGTAGSLAAARLAGRYGLVPPDHGGVYGVAETLTYATQRILTSRQSLAREFDRSQISKVVPVNGPPPENEIYERLAAADFEQWHLSVEGLVRRPAALSLAELKRFPSRSQITLQACEEGWSFMAEWTGVPLSLVLDHVGVRSEAKYVVLYPFDQWWDSIDMFDARHSQTLLAYGLNGEDLPQPHGAPLRLKLPRQLGYKNIKYLSRIVLVDDLKPIGNGLGSATPEIGYSWYAGI
jgi:DMSO/TMAO reductase YedYZ molybdopterin-dependent catalytic subunit